MQESKQESAGHDPDGAKSEDTQDQTERRPRGRDARAFDLLAISSSGDDAERRLLHTILDGIPEPVFAKDSESRYVYVNTAAANLLGAAPSEIIGRGDAAFFSPDDVRHIRAGDIAVMESGTMQRREEVVETAEGRRAFLVTRAPYRDDEGRSVGLIGIAREVGAPAGRDPDVVIEQLQARTAEAEAARAEAEDEEERARLLDEAGRLLHSSLEPERTLAALVRLMVPVFADACSVDVADEDGRLRRLEFAFGDEGACEMAELPERDDPAGTGEPGLYRVLRTGRAELYREVGPQRLRSFASGDDHLRRLEALGIRSAMLVPMEAGGRRLGVMTLLSTSGREYTPDDLRLAEEVARRAAVAIDHARLFRASEEANRAKSEFLATMSHELRTPLNAITGYADLLQLGVSDEAQRYRHLERIKASAWHLLSVIEEILTFSRLEAGREQLKLESFDAAGLAAEAAAMVEPVADRKGIAFEVTLPDGGLRIATDRAKLRQILLNLLGNALKFTEVGQVTLRVEPAAEGDAVLFHVRDTGPGIAQEDVQRIFDPFWQADRGPRRRSGGTGLGLTVSRDLAQLLGGSIELRSRYGAGSEFTLRLPLGGAGDD